MHTHHLQQRNIVICDTCRGKDVLDVGSTGQTAAYDLWPQIKQVARSVRGIDPLPHNDPDIMLGDMEQYQFHTTFDVVVCGDVLEHVQNQGLFLANIKKHLKDNGKLIITTPNAKWFTVMLAPNPTHTLWHDQYTLAYVLGQNGFMIEYFAYYCGNKPYYHPLVRPLVWRQGMLVVCTKAVAAS